jgi:hypothetical protein
MGEVHLSTEDRASDFFGFIRLLFVLVPGIYRGPGLHRRGDELRLADVGDPECMLERPTDSADGMVAARASSNIVRSSFPEAGKDFHFSGFHALLSACTPNGSVDYPSLSLAPEALLASYEPLAEFDRCFRDYALAVRLHQPGDKAVFVSRSGRLSCLNGRTNTQLATPAIIGPDLRTRSER